MARRVQRSPVEVAVERLAKMATDGATPAGMCRAAYDIAERWKAEADTDIASRWIGVLHASVVSGLAAAQEEVDDLGNSKPEAVERARAVIDALQAARDVLATELERMD